MNHDYTEALDRNEQLQDALEELREKYQKALKGLLCIAQGTACVCETGCPRCDAIETLQELGERYE